MNDLIKALELSINNKNWYGALFLALCIPDICGYIESPKKKSQDRYEQWFKEYMLSKYSFCVGPEHTPQVFLSPSDCYALRCAILHEGRDVILEQNAREALDRFHFIEPPPRGIQIHCNRINNNILQLQVDIFCNDMINGLRKWQQNIHKIPDIEQRFKNILKVYPSIQIPKMSDTK